MSYIPFVNPMPVTGAFYQATQPVTLTSTTVTGTVTVTGGLTDTQLRATAVPVSLASVPTHAVTKTDVSASGNLTAVSQAVTLSSLSGKISGLVQLSGTWVGSVQLEGSNDGFVTVTTLSTTQSGGASPNTNPITTTGDFRVLGITNYASIRVRCSAYTSGTIVVNLKASDGNGIMPVISTNASGFLCTASQGGTWTVTGAGGTFPVTGTFWQATQPISAVSLPVPADITASGTITTQNLVPAGTATAGSAVAIALSGQNTLAVQVTGTYTGALSLQATVDGTTWVTLAGCVFIAPNGVGAATIPSASQSLYISPAAGYTQLRVTGLAAMTGTATISLRASVSTGQVSVLRDSAGELGRVSASANLIGDVGVQYRATATGGASVAKILATASTNATCPKASAGRLLGWTLTNTTAAVKVVHIHDLAVAPTVGTSVPKFSIVIPPNQLQAHTIEGGIAMATGIAYSITGAIADLDTTVTTANDVIGALYYA